MRSKFIIGLLVLSGVLTTLILIYGHNSQMRAFGVMYLLIAIGFWRVVDSYKKSTFQAIKEREITAGKLKIHEDKEARLQEQLKKDADMFDENLLNLGL